MGHEAEAVEPESETREKELSLTLCAANVIALLVIWNSGTGQSSGGADGARVRSFLVTGGFGLSPGVAHSTFLQRAWRHGRISVINDTVCSNLEARLAETTTLLLASSTQPVSGHAQHTRPGLLVDGRAHNQSESDKALTAEASGPPARPPMPCFTTLTTANHHRTTSTLGLKLLVVCLGAAPGPRPRRITSFRPITASIQPPWRSMRTNYGPATSSTSSPRGNAVAKQATG